MCLQSIFLINLRILYNVNIKENETRLDQEALTEGYTVPEGRQIKSVEINPDAMLTLPNDVTIADTTPEVVYTTADDGSQTGEVIYTYGGNEVGRTPILVATEEVRQILPDVSAAVEEPANASGVTGFIEQVKTLAKELGMLKSLTGLAILVALILIIIFSIRRAFRRRKQKKILSKVKQTSAPVIGEVEDFDLDDEDETAEDIEMTVESEEEDMPEENPVDENKQNSEE